MKKRLKIIVEKISSKVGLFSVKQIANETMISSKDVQIVLDRLFREGMVQRFDLIPNPGEGAPLRGRPRKRTIYQVTNKTKLKKRFGPKVKQNAVADRMWKLIRAKRDFTIRDLVVLTGAKKENARWFVKNLYRERYIAPSKSGGPGVEWSLIKLRDPGPQRPYLGKK
jgi:predicted ArsR family transcriptional regulator